MSHTDTIADLLTRMRNAKDAEHKYVDVRFSKLNLAILETLKRRGYIQHYLLNEKKRQVRVFLRYNLKTRKSILQGLKRISKPGMRRYVGYQDIPHVMSGLGMAILSTPSGVLDGHKARELKVGGEILCVVW